MEDRRICDYFVIAGLPNASKRTKQRRDPANDQQSPQHNDQETNELAPITDIAIIITTLDEDVPEGYFCINKTPSGFVADLS